MRVATLCFLLVIGAMPAAAARQLIAERVVILMRHGVRPPTKQPAMPVGVAAEPWPTWPVQAGYLTPHGAKAVTLLGRSDRKAFAREAMVPRVGCPALGAVEVISDSDQRTIATADAWLAGFAPGCRIANIHRPQDEVDPRFSPIDAAMVDFDPKAADAAVASALTARVIVGAQSAEQANLDRLNAILCGAARQDCGVTQVPTSLVPAKPAARPKLTGALDRASSVAQILLLEYADGKPMSEVGWGRATASDVTRLSSLHATEFALLARPKYIAARNLAPLAKIMRSALKPKLPGAPTVTLIVGHDTNIANLAGLLGVHWQVSGFSPDDPAPGGALILRLLRDRHGRHLVQISYRAQTLEGIRSLNRSSKEQLLRVIGCGLHAGGLCSFKVMTKMLASSASLFPSNYVVRAVGCHLSRARSSPSSLVSEAGREDGPATSQTRLRN